MSLRKVILLDRLGKTGAPGDVISVKAGYARNYLIPLKKALYANKASIEHYENISAQLKADVSVRTSLAEKEYNSLNKKEVNIIVKSSQDGKIFGSVSTKDIVQKINSDLSLSLVKGQVVLSKPIKVLGVYDIIIRLYAGYEAIISCCIASDVDSVADLRKSAKVSEDILSNSE